MNLGIAMGGYVNTVLHVLGVEQEARDRFLLGDIDMRSHESPCLYNEALNTRKYHIQGVTHADVHIAINDALANSLLVDTSVRRVDEESLTEADNEHSITSQNRSEKAIRKYSCEE